MIIFGDYHTHTSHSRNHHGKGTILENASVAQAKGLKQIAITDHGFNQITFGLKRKELHQIKDEVLTAQDITGVKILFGVEANLTSLNGDIDVVNEDFEYIDLVSMGHHKLVKFNSFTDFCSLGAGNILSDIFSPTKSQINKNTTAFLKALDKNHIDIITHLNYGCPTDTLAVAKMAKQKNVFIEINGRKIHFTDEELITMAEEGVQFILGSDAHRPEDVGEVNLALNKIIQLKIPISQVANLDKLPKFKKRL